MKIDEKAFEAALREFNYIAGMNGPDRARYALLEAIQRYEAAKQPVDRHQAFQKWVNDKYGPQGTEKSSSDLGVITYNVMQSLWEGFDAACDIFQPQKG